MSGWIKLHRSLKDSAIADHPEYFSVFVHLLIRAQHSNSECLIGKQLIKLSAGQLVFGRIKFSAEIGVSENKIRSALDVLKSLNMITIKSMSKFSIISITNWDFFQNESPANHHETTSNAPAEHQQATTYKNDKNVNNDKNKDFIAQDKPAKKTIVKPELDFSVWHEQPDQQILNDWIDMRKKKKGSFSQTVIDGFGDEFRKAQTFGYSVNDCLRRALMGNWTGFKAQWMQNQDSRGNGNAGYQSAGKQIGLDPNDTSWADQLFTGSQFAQPNIFPAERDISSVAYVIQEPSRGD